MYFLTNSSLKICCVPEVEPTVLIMPNTLPECFGAMSMAFTADPKLWKLFENIAVVHKKRAME